MKKEDLTALGLSDEQVAGVQKLNGLDIQKEKDKVTVVEKERDDFKNQLTDTQEKLKGFDGVDVTALKGEITKLTEDLTAKDTEYQQKIADRDFSDKLTAAITKIGGKNAKAILANLDIDAIKVSNNQDTDLETALTKCKEDNDYLFGSEEPFKNPLGQTGGSGGTALTPEQISGLSFEDYKAYRNK